MAKTTTPQQNKAIVLEAFDTLFNKRDYEAAKKWYHSAQYEAEAARHVRTGAAELNMMVVEGL